MPIIYNNDYERSYSKRLRKLHSELISYGVRDRTIAEWLGCTSQNVSNHWQKKSFSGFQIHTIEEHLKEIKAAEGC